MKKIFPFLLLFLMPVLFVGLVQAGGISERPRGVATPYWYNYSSGSPASYYLAAPTLSANDTATGLLATQTLTNKTISGAANTITDIGNSSLSNGNSYFTMVCKHEGQETATLDPICTFQMPFAATLVEISATIRDIDTGDANETYTLDVEEAGTTVLSAAISIVADNTPVVGVVSDADIADNAKIEIVQTLGGTSPAADDTTLLLTFKVAHSN